VLKMRAKPGMGDALFEFTTSLHYTDDPDLPVDWFLCRADDDPDVLWALEFYKDGGVVRAPFLRSRCRSQP
jgi:hypothetical protein